MRWLSNYKSLKSFMAPALVFWQEDVFGQNFISSNRFFLIELTKWKLKFGNAFDYSDVAKTEEKICFCSNMNGATTFSIAAFSMMTLGITTQKLARVIAITRHSFQ